MPSVYLQQAAANAGSLVLKEGSRGKWWGREKAISGQTLRRGREERRGREGRGVMTEEKDLKESGTKAEGSDTGGGEGV